MHSFRLLKQMKVSQKLWSICFTDDPNLLVSGGADNLVRIWDISAGSNLILRGHSQSITKVRFSEKYIASCSLDQTICLWDSHSYTQTHKFNSRTLLESVSISKDCRYVVASQRNELACWEIDTGIKSTF